jgi:primary-amine oxidase
MVLDRLKQVAAHVTGHTGPPHPLDPLSEFEIERAVSIIRKEHSGLFFNAVTLLEPRKIEMMAFVTDPEHSPRPRRVADIVCVAKGSKVYDGHVDLNEGKIIKWELTEGVQPLVSRFPELKLLLLR